MQLFLKVNDKYFLKINMQLHIYTYMWKICRQSGQGISPCLYKAAQTASPVYPVSVGICWSCNCTWAFPQLQLQWTHQPSPRLIGKGGEHGQHTPPPMLSPSPPSSDPADAAPALVLPFPCPYYEKLVYHYWPYIPLPDPATERVSTSPSGDGAVALTESRGDILKERKKSQAKAEQRLCCQMSAHGRHGLVGSAACRPVSWKTGHEFSLWLSSVEAEEY